MPLYLRELPKTVRVGASDLTVIRVDELFRDSEKQILGQLHGAQQVIKVESDMPVSVQLRTLMHEIIHEILDQAGQTLDENIIIVLETGITCLLRDNPAFARTMTGDYRYADENAGQDVASSEPCRTEPSS